MVFSKLLSPWRATLLLVTILSAAQSSVAAPTADIGTAVSSAPKPVPNLVPSTGQFLHKTEEISLNTPNSEDEIKRRSLNVVPESVVSSDTSAQKESAIDDTIASTDPPPKHLGKRQTRPRSQSAPAILSTPPDSPNTNDEEDAIGNAAEKIKQAADQAVNNMKKVADAAVRNAADEQKDGIDNPYFHGNKPDSYIWPTGNPVQSPVPTFSAWNPYASPAAAAAAAAAAVPVGQGFQVLDGNGNPIRNNALQPQEMIPGVEQYFDPNLSDEPDFQVLDGNGNPIQGNALQPQAMVPGAEQYFDPTLFDEPEAFQVLDGNGNPIRDNALQPQDVIPGVQQYSDPTLLNEPFQVLDGNGNPIRDNALQPQDVISGAGQYSDPTLSNQPFQVLDGNGNPIEGDALQPIATIPGPATAGAPSDSQIVSGADQTPSGQTIQNYDPSVIPAIVSAPDLWRQVLDDPNVQQFLQDNTPEGLQALLDPDTRSQLEQNPNIANYLVPGLNNPTPENITPFLNLLDNLPLDQQLNLVSEGPDIAGLAQTDPTELASVMDTIDNLRTPSLFPINGFRNDFLPDPYVHIDSGSMPFTPNGFESNPIGPFGPPLLPQLDGINQNFDGTINQQPGGVNQDIFGGTFGAIPTNVFLPNGGTISFNCVPIYIDAYGNQRSASDVPSQILSAFNVNGPSTFTDQTTDPNTPLTPFLNEVVTGNPDIISASQIDDNTVLVNTEGGDDAEQVIKNFGNGWDMKAQDTDGVDGLDSITLANGGTRFQINQPQGFATAAVLDAKAPSDILSTAFGEGASVQLETANVAPVPAAA